MGSTDEAREQVRRRLDAVTGRSGPLPRDTDLPPEGVDGEHPDWLDGPEQSPARVRFAPGRRGVVALAAVALVAAGLGVVVTWRDRPVAEAVSPLPAAASATVPDPTTEPVPPPSRPSPAPPPPTPVDEIVVSVVGLVHISGLVHLPPGSRVADALAAAGGARDGADLLGLNLAQRLSDGDQVLVGLAPPPGAAPVAGSATVGAGQAAAEQAGGPAGGKVNLNTATEQQLDALPGVGPVTAAAILAWRTANGTFTDVEQLGEVDGIGPARLQKLRDLVAVR